MTEIRPCSGGVVIFALTANHPDRTQRYMACRSEFQDTRYGRGMRVHNLSGKKDGNPRCTVCGFGNGVVRP